MEEYWKQSIHFYFKHEISDIGISAEWLPWPTVTRRQREHFSVSIVDVLNSKDVVNSN